MHKKIAYLLKYLNNFGFKMTMNHFAIGLRASLGLCTSCKEEELNKTKINYLKSEFEKDIELLKKEYKSCDCGINKTIYTFWDSKNKPDLVKMCENSLVNNIADIKFICLNDDTLMRYCLIPQSIMEKYKKGVISKTHFSDIIRVNLLYQSGGCWLDSTIFASGELDFIFKNNFWTMRRPQKKEDHSIAQGRWTSFAMASNKNNKLVYYLSNLFEKYWEKHNEMIDYFLIDMFISILYNDDIEIKKMIDAVEINNIDYHKLSEWLSSSEVDVCDIKKINSCLHKLNRKQILLKETNGKKSLYGKLLDYEQ